MGLTKKKQYDSYTFAYKVKAVKESNKKGVKAIDVARALGIHPVMLYRWRQEFKEGRLSENKHMKIPQPPPKKSREESDRLKVIILKKAKRFFSDRRKKDTRSN